MVKYTKLLRGCGLFAHLRWEEGLGVSSGKRIDLSLARFANLLSLPPSAAVACLHREESWGTEAGAKWTLSWFPGRVLQRAQLLRSLIS